MLNIIFAIAVIWVSWKLFIFGIKATWGIAKILCTVLLFPLFIAGLVFVGLIYIAIPIMVIVGLVVLVGGIGKI